VKIGNLTHTFDGDLLITLISPSGTRVVLSNRAAAAATTSSTRSSTTPQRRPSQRGAAPFTGSFKPDGVLGTLAGQNADGNWQLEINDQASGDSGTLNSWSITFSNGERSAVSGSTGTYTFQNVAAGTYDVRQVNQPGGRRPRPPADFTPSRSTPRPTRPIATSETASRREASAASSSATTTATA
jgi:subtilisin-like proprotein convertase family protein